MSRKPATNSTNTTTDNGIVELLKAIGLSAVTVAPGIVALTTGKKGA